MKDRGIQQGMAHLTFEADRIAAELGIALSVRWNTSHADFDRNRQTLELTVGSKRLLRKFSDFDLGVIPNDPDTMANTTRELRRLIYSLA